jgi:hypothetical protein
MPSSSPASSRTVSAWVVAVIASLLFAVGLATAPVATADSCANATLRAQNNSTDLPDCRAYEMVSAPYKEGFGILPASNTSFTDDGLLSYQSRGAFAGNEQGNAVNTYHATRSGAGWTTSSIEPPGAQYSTASGGELGVPVQAESADLKWSLWRMYRRDTETPADIGFWLRDPHGVFTRACGALFFAYSKSSDGDQLPGASSDDLSHFIVGLNPLSECVGTGNGGPPRTVTVTNDGQPTPAAPCLRDVSSDGRVIVFGSGCNSGTPSELWARVGGSATVAVSGSECTRPFGDPNGVCNPFSAPAYAGAADDGSRVFFTTSQQLVNGDIDQTNDLYACDIPAGEPEPVGTANHCATLTQVSGAATDAQVRRAVAVSKDGSRVYFVAQGVLAGNLGVGGFGAVAGADNLYLWERDDAHPAGQTRYVARLADSGDDLARAQLTPDNRYLLFTTANRLVDSGAGADADDARDVYRYDAVTHALVRVSTSIAGGGGNAAGFDANIPQASGMSADGSTVVFATAEALSPDADTNGVTDAYAWRDGQVSLISADGGNAVGVTPSGRDIFFITSAQVLPADGDLGTDIYTARLGGGFARPQPPAPCSGDSCQGLLSGVSGLAGPRSGLSGDSDPQDAAAAFSLRAVSAAQRRRLAATGKLSLTVAANAAGRVTATARARISGRSVTVGSGRRTMTTPGSVAVALKLSRKARRLLAARGRLTVKVVVSHSKATRGRSVTLKLTGARASKRSSVGGRS